MSAGSSNRKKAVACTFCRVDTKTAKIIIQAREGLAICGDCVALCVGIVEEETVRSKWGLGKRKNRVATVHKK